MVAVVACPVPVLQFLNNQGLPNSGGTLLTQVGGVNAPTYSDSGGMTPFPNPIPLNSRGEISTAAGASSQLFLPINTVYTFTLFDDLGNQLWSEPYVNGAQLTGSQIASLLNSIINAPILASYDQSQAEIDSEVTIVNYSYPPLCVERYGADPSGVSDSTAAFNAAFAVGRSIGSGVASNYSQAYSWAGGTYLITGALTLYTDHVGFNGRGCWLNCSTMTSSSTIYVFNPANDTTDPTARGALNAAHPLENFIIVGPGTTQQVGAFNFNDSGADQVVAGILIRNGGSLNFNVHANYVVGSFFETFQDWFFDSALGGSSGNFITIGAESNAGERNCFVRCRFGVSNNAGIQQSNGNATTFFTDCSFDGANQFMTQTAGISFFHGCHVESNGDVANTAWFALSGSNSAMYWEGLALVQGASAAKNNYAPFYCDATVVAGVLKIKNWQFEGSGVNAWTVPIVAGTGNTEIDAPGTYEAGAQPYYISQFQNILSDPGFESAAFTDDGWTTSGGTAPTVATTNPHTGTYSAKFAGVSGQTNSLILTRGCKSGQMLMGQAWIASTGWTSPTVFNATVAFLGAGGQTISSYSAITTVSATQAYALTRLSTFGKAPPGTVNVSLTFSISGTTSGTPFAYVDDLVLNVV